MSRRLSLNVKPHAGMGFRLNLAVGHQRARRIDKTRLRTG